MCTNKEISSAAHPRPAQARWARTLGGQRPPWVDPGPRAVPEWQPNLSTPNFPLGAGLADPSPPGPSSPVSCKQAYAYSVVYHWSMRSRFTGEDGLAVGRARHIAGVKVGLLIVRDDELIDLSPHLILGHTSPLRDLRSDPQRQRDVCSELVALGRRQRRESRQARVAQQWP